MPLELISAALSGRSSRTGIESNGCNGMDWLLPLQNIGATGAANRLIQVIFWRSPLRNAVSRRGSFTRRGVSPRQRRSCHSGRASSASPPE